MHKIAQGKLESKYRYVITNIFVNFYLQMFNLMNMIKPVWKYFVCESNN